ncbi:MAG: InlB B-repeat-containing protein [Atopobiaceae bacterium]|nr:InlB B-repeat-containing protein [Atopobiaceae bacterium]
MKKDWRVLARVCIAFIGLVAALGLYGVFSTPAAAAKTGRYEITVTCELTGTDNSQSPEKKIKGSASFVDHSDTLPAEISLSKDAGNSPEYLVNKIVREQLKVPAKTDLLCVETDKNFNKSASPKNSPTKLTTSGKVEKASYAKNPVYYTVQQGKDGPVVNVKVTFSVAVRDTKSTEDGLRAQANSYSLTVTVDPPEGGSFNNPSGESVEEGHAVSITTAENPGYQFVGWEVDPENLEKSEDGGTIGFNMPASLVTVTAKYAPIHFVTVNVDSATKGNASANPSSAIEGTEITLAAEPNPGFVFDAWTVNSGSVVISENNTFSMPDNDVNITASFKEAPAHTISVTTAGNGTASADKESAAEGEEVTLTATPSSGFVFDHWVTVPEDLQITDDGVFAMPDQDVQATAYFEAIPAPTSYSIAVTNDGHGSATASKTSATEGESITLTATPSSGYEFKEWQVVKPDGLKISGNAFTMPAGDVEVKAIFAEKPAPKPTSYSVTVTNDGHGSATASKSTATQGETITLSATAKSGYVFSKWKVVSPSSLTISGNAFTMPAANVEVKAVFKAKPAPKPQTYTVSFSKNANDASGEMTNQVITRGVSTQLTQNKFQRSGYTFSGWNTAADGSGTSYANGQAVKDLAAANKTITLFAQWRRIVYTVSYNANGGSGTMAPQSVNAGEVTSVKANIFTRAGYTFTGWNTRSDGTGTFIKDRASMEVNGNVTLYAQWSRNNTSNNQSNVVRTSNGTLARTADSTTYSIAALAALCGVSLLHAWRRRQSH